MKSFRDKVIAVVKNIPRGHTMTYRQVAIAVGSPNASRAVGSILAKNTDKKIPCHRVIRSDGTLGSYNGLGGKSKEILLREEGFDC